MIYTGYINYLQRALRQALKSKRLKVIHLEEEDPCAVGACSNERPCSGSLSQVQRNCLTFFDYLVRTWVPISEIGDVAGLTFGRSDITSSRAPVEAKHCQIVFLFLLRVGRVRMGM